MAPTELPYDVLLHIFKEVAILRNDRIEGKTSSWLLSSTSVDLLSCALVARSWRLPAQQSLWRAIDLSELALKPFLRTAARRPDLARQVQVFAVAYRLGLDHRLALTKEEKLLTSLFLPALAVCPNVRTLYSNISDEQPGFEAVITSLQHLETWCGGGTLQTMVELAGATPTLRRLEVGFLEERWPTEPPRSLSSPAPISTLRFWAEKPAVPLQLIKAVGQTLRQLCWYLEDPLPPEASLAAFSTTTSSLHHLYLILYSAENGPEDTSWFETLLPQFAVLEKLFLSTDGSFASTAELLRGLPASLRWLEITDYSDTARGLIKEILGFVPST